MHLMLDSHFSVRFHGLFTRGPSSIDYLACAIATAVPRLRLVALNLIRKVGM